MEESPRGRGWRAAKALRAGGLVCGGALVVTLASAALARAAPTADTKPATQRAAVVLMDTAAIATVASSSELRSKASPPASHRRFSWPVLAAAILGAVLVAGYIGNTFASHRPPRPKPSIYAVIEARLKAEKATAHTVEPEGGDGKAADTGSSE